MKTKTSLFTIAALALILAVSSCGSQEKKSTTTTTTEKVTAEKKYQCPMKCEGEKTYAKPGTCPVCEMDLAELKIGK